ncbi:hypothetical protein ACKWTF_014404 [Chironomus riparius]
MKFLMIFSALLSMAFGASILNTILSNQLEVPRSVCVGQPTGTTFPIALECNMFIMCKNNEAVIGQCRFSEPYFHPCEFRCTADPNVCSKACINLP